MASHSPLISKFVPGDVAAALRLSTQAGWNQLEADWSRLIHLWPDACFAIRDEDGAVIATSTLASYGGVGWVGMVLVDEPLRGRGLGRAILGAAVVTGEKLDAIGLDATDLGMPVYAKHGFTSQIPINRWGGSVNRPCQSGARPAVDDDWHAILEMDCRATGVDRSTLLRAMADEPGVRLRVIEEYERLSGFGFARPGRVAGHVGPVVAKSAEVAAELTCALCNEQRVFIDVPATPTNAAFTAWLEQSSLSILRRLTRMVRPAREEPLLAGPRVFATAALELG
jgi:GNAT superfamily N-acetyltransferase